MERLSKMSFQWPTGWNDENDDEETIFDYGDNSVSRIEKCLSPKNICDQKFDCSDQSDETNCPTSCEPKNLKIHNKYFFSTKNIACNDDKICVTEPCEEKCLESQITWYANLWFCNDKCIEKERQCNGKCPPDMPIKSPWGDGFCMTEKDCIAKVLCISRQFFLYYILFPTNL